MSELGVLGAGAWGTALAIQAARAGRRVVLWARDPAHAARIEATRDNPRLPGHALPPGVRVTADRARALAAPLAVVAVPMQALGRALEGASPRALVLCAKGVEADTARFPLEVAAAACPGAALAVLSGPNFAGEIAAGAPAAAVLASADPALRQAALEALGTQNFRLYASEDPVGVQVGGAAKNVLAIAAGAVIGAGLGENARAALVTRGLAELARLTVALGGRAETAMGLSGVGDLLLTTTGAASRNFSLGLALGAGRLAPPGLAEGAATAPALLSRAAAHGLELPVCAAVAGLLADQLTVAAATEALLSRPARLE